MKIKGALLIVVLSVLLCSSGVFAADVSLKGSGEPDGHIPYMNGYEDGTFRPDKAITRAEVCKVLFNLMKEAPPVNDSQKFTDTKAGAWYNISVNALSDTGLIVGYSGGLFKPEANITRAEFVTIMTRIYGEEPNGSGFVDVSGSHWARNSILTAQHKGWVNGYKDGSFRPDDNITRAELTAIINRITNRDLEFWQTEQGQNYQRRAAFPDISSTKWHYWNVLEAVVQLPTYYGEGTLVIDATNGSEYYVKYRENCPRIQTSTGTGVYHGIYTEGDKVDMEGITDGGKDFSFGISGGYSGEWLEFEEEKFVWDSNNPTVYAAGTNTFKCTYDGVEYTWTVEALPRWGVYLDTADSRVDTFDSGGWEYGWNWDATLSTFMDWYGITLKVGESINVYDLIRRQNCKILSITAGKVYGPFTWDNVHEYEPTFPWKFNTDTGTLTLVKGDEMTWAGPQYTGITNMDVEVLVELATGEQVTMSGTIKLFIDD